MAEMNWASAELMAHVDKIILEEGYGCDVELVAGATMPTFTSMNEKGEPDVAAEQWANAVRDPLKKAVDEGRLHVINKAPITGNRRLIDDMQTSFVYRLFQWIPNCVGPLFSSHIRFTFLVH